MIFGSFTATHEGITALQGVAAPRPCQYYETLWGYRTVSRGLVPESARGTLTMLALFPAPSLGSLSPISLRALKWNSLAIPLEYLHSLDMWAKKHQELRFIARMQTSALTTSHSLGGRSGFWFNRIIPPSSRIWSNGSPTATTAAINLSGMLPSSFLRRDYEQRTSGGGRRIRTDSGRRRRAGKARSEAGWE